MNSPKRPLTASQALSRAAALCSRSEQAPADIRQKLLRWGLNANDASQVLNQLAEQGFIDEERYARAFVNDRFTFNGWGKTKIAYQLRIKGIPAETAQEALALIDEQEYRDRLVELLRAKWRTVGNREQAAAIAAMMRFAASRGFEASLASQCIKEVTRVDAQDD